LKCLNGTPNKRPSFEDLSRQLKFLQHWNGTCDLGVEQIHTTRLLELAPTEEELFKREQLRKYEQQKKENEKLLEDQEHQRKRQEHNQILLLQQQNKSIFN